MTKVDIAIACGPNQVSKWWGAVMGMLMQEQQAGIEIGQLLVVGSALPDFNKTNIVGGTIQPPASEEEKRRNELTDSNRTTASSRFLTGKPEINWLAEYIMWLDDDTIPPDGVISHLISLNRDAVGGLYFNANPPKNPIAYIRERDWGGYKALYDYPEGALVEVDSIGMGCTLVHRSVYEKIMDAHEIFMRPNGSLVPVLKTDIQNKGIPELAKLPPSRQVVVDNGWMCTRIVKPDPEDNRSWPFFAMEYGRTEDHYFWELARNVGVKPWVDTTVKCGHIKSYTVEWNDYKELLNERKGLSTGAG